MIIILDLVLYHNMHMGLTDNTIRLLGLQTTNRIVLLSIN